MLKLCVTDNKGSNYNNTKTFLIPMKKGSIYILPDFFFSDSLLGVLKLLTSSIVVITLGPMMKIN